MPPAWRDSTREEIREYYAQEFPGKVSKLPEHISPTGPLEYALALLDKHPRKGDAPSESWVRRTTRVGDEEEGEWGEPVFVNADGQPDFEAVLDFIRQPATNDPRHEFGDQTPLQKPASAAKRPVAEAVYYRLLNHNRGWVLAFDIDAKDVCYWEFKSQFEESATPKEVLEEMGIHEEAPKGYPYRFQDISQALTYAFELAEFLREDLEHKKILPVYSGQGAHVYSLDEDYVYTRTTRQLIGEYLHESKHLNVPIDQVVTGTPSRLIRMPYSLHSDVSRITMPISSPDYDFRSQPVPDFLSS